MIATISFQYETNDYAIRVLNNESGTYKKLESKLLSDLVCEIQKLIGKGLSKVFIEDGYQYIYDKMNVYLFDDGYHFNAYGDVVTINTKAVNNG